MSLANIRMTHTALSQLAGWPDEAFVAPLVRWERIGLCPEPEEFEATVSEALELGELESAEEDISMC